MTIKTIKRITCDDTGRIYEVVDGKATAIMPQLWEIKLEFRLFQLPDCTTTGHPITIKKLLVERQFLVDTGLVPKSNQDRVAKQQDVEQALLKLLEAVGVVPNKEPSCSTEFLN